MSRFYDAQPQNARVRMKAELATLNPRVHTVVFMDFEGDPVYWSDSVVGFEDANGQFWEGAGQVIEISAPSGGADNFASFVEYKISFPTSMIDEGGVRGIPNVFSDRSIYLRRIARVGLQFFDDAGAIGVPVILHTGEMYQPKLSASPGLLSLSVVSENAFLNKRRPPFGDLTSSDQRGRYSDDAGLDFVPNAATEQKDWLNS